MSARSRTLAGCVLALLGLALPGLAGGDLASDPRAGQPRRAAAHAVADDAREVARLLAIRCARCHGAGADDRKALRDWDQAHDLAATVAAGLVVVPGEPLDSDLFLVCDDGDMPPEGEPEAALSTEELALLERWIAAGAPLPADVPEEAETPAAGGNQDTAAPPEELPGAEAPVNGATAAPAQVPEQTPPPVSARHRGARDWLSFAGRWHVLVLHFPVVLIVLASLGALRRGLPGPLTRLHLDLAVPMSIVTAATGWILAESTSGDLELHRWLGVATAVLTAATAVAVRRASEERSGPWRLLLVVTLFLMLSAAHGGGELVHGEDWLRMPLDP